MTKISIIHDIQTDANNRWEACNGQSHGRNRKDFAKTEDKEIVEKIAGKIKEEAKEILVPYLQKRYEENIEYFENKIAEANDILQKEKDKIFEYMAKLTKHPIEYEEIIFWVTTFPRCPYNREKGQIWLYIDSKFPRYRARVFAHELIHFQFHRYYTNHPKVKLLSKEQFEKIKESTTFLLNHEFHEVNMAEDKGYPIYDDYRKQIETYWIGLVEKDFDKLVDYGCDLLLNK